MGPSWKDLILVSCRPKYLEWGGWSKLKSGTKIQMYRLLKSVVGENVVGGSKKHGIFFLVLKILNYTLRKYLVEGSFLGRFDFSTM